MAAIYKRELKSFFHSFIGWLYTAVMLFMIGLYFTLCNMLAGYPTISYVLQFIVFLLLFTVPILTMRSLSEERKYKTDQLILTSPVSVGGIVMGKYFALVTVFAIPPIILGLMPLILMRIGEFQTGLSYTSLLGFLLYGCLGLAIGLFVSSLTESVVIAAVLTLIIMFVGYVMSGLCSIISASGTTALADYIVKILSCFDLVGRFDILTIGYFEVKSVVYYVTFTAFVLFCTVQSIQKRRYAFAGKGVKIGAYSIFNILVAAAVTILVNVGLSYVPEQYISYDVTVNKVFTLTEDAVQFVSNLTEDVTIYVLADEASKDSDLDRTLQQLKGYSDHISVEYISPVSNPMFYYKYTDTQPITNSLIVVSKNASAVVDYSDIYIYETDYYTYQSVLTAYDGEGQIVSAIMRVASDDIPKFYAVFGHNEIELEEIFIDALLKENVDYDDLVLQTTDAIPEDAYGIILDAPLSDYSESDTEKILEYLERGGNALIVIPTPTETNMDRFEQIIGYYGVSLADGVIVEGDRGYYYQTPYDLFPDIAYDKITERIYDGLVLAPKSRGLIYDENAENVRYIPFLTTSDGAFSQSDYLAAKDYSKGSEDIVGPFVIGMKIEKPTGNGKTSQAVIISTEQMFTSGADSVVPGYNAKLFSGIVASLADHDISTAIPVKYYEIGNLIFSAGTVLVVAIVSIFVLPIGCLVTGFIIWFRRRKK